MSHELIEDLIAGWYVFCMILILAILVKLWINAGEQ